MEQPNNINDINGDFVLDYCKERGGEAVEWLKEVYNTPVKADKNGRERTISFIEVRNRFVQRYFPALLPKSGKKKKTLKDRLNEL